MKSLVRYLLIGGAVLLILLLLVVGGAFLLRPQLPPGEPPSPVLVTVLHPSSGEEFAVGDYLTVSAQAIAPEALVSTELFVDGQSIGSITDGPELAAWSWQASPVGIHTLQARATDASGQVGNSQTVVVNVLPGDGTMEVAAGPGQTAEQIGAAYGVPLDQMAGSNPKLDPTQPLQDGQPVKVPTGGGAGSGAGAAGPPGAGGFNPVLLITWQFKPTAPVDKSYCYTSTGNGAWEKMPKKVFEFFLTPENVFEQAFEALPQQEPVIQMQCWGWLGGTLKYLGQGETGVDATKPPSQVVVSGDEFQFVGLVKIPPPSDDAKGGLIAEVPPPYALRQPKDAADCTAHGHPLIAPFICNTLMQAKVKENYVLVWEWQPKPCWPGYCNWMNDVATYRVFEIDPFTKTEKLLKEITNPNNKVAAVPLPWGAKCYSVRAYAKDPAFAASEAATYCPDQALATQKVTLTPTEWLTTGGAWIDEGDGCSPTVDNYGYPNASKTSGFGGVPGQVGVGALLKDFDGVGCYLEANESGAVKFLLPNELQPGTVVQHATLRFSEVIGGNGTTGISGGAPDVCAGSVGKAKQSWAGLNAGNHYSSQNALGSTAYFSPISSVPPVGPIALDVTSAVSEWVKNSQSNHGLIFTSAPVLAPILDEDDNGYSYCWSGIGNVVLEIEYIAP